MKFFFFFYKNLRERKNVFKNVRNKLKNDKHENSLTSVRPKIHSMLTLSVTLVKVFAIHAISIFKTTTTEIN